MKRVCLTIVVLAVVAAVAPADDCALGIASSGRVGLNDEVIDKFGQKADSDDDWFYFDDEDQDAAKDAGRWIDVAMDGHDWYTLRGDGVLFENGRKLAHAKWPGDKGHRWVSLAAGDGRVYALCEDGRLRRDGDIVARFPRDSLDFSAVLLAAGTVFTLRWDGALFMGLSESPRFDLTGPPDPLGRREGEDGDTRFIALAADPGEDYVYALRADGAICRAGPIGDDPEAEYVASVPRPSSGALRAADRCADLQFTEDGTLRVLRRTGEVFRSPSFLTPECVLPPIDGDDAFADLAALGNQAYALRRDGTVFRVPDGWAATDLPARGYKRMVVSSSVPDLDHARDRKPEAASYDVTVVEGEALTLPLAIGDLETSDPISFVEDALPPGATFTPATGVLSWSSPGPPGTYKVSVMVDDTQNKPRRFRQTIVVVPAGGNSGRDEDPILPAVKGLYALAGQELRFAVPVTDPEGDPFTVTPDGDSYAFAHGATYDSATGLVRWTPAAGDTGSRAFRFEVVQGSFRRVLEVRVLVDYPLFALAGVP